jgi:Gram-negative bacterial TonB protein C-terminal
MSTRDDLPPETAVRIADSPSARLVRYAAGRMPPDLAERLEEEWIADLAEQHGSLSRMRFALGCWWAKEVIGHEPHLYGARLSAASHGDVGVVAPLFPSPLPRRAAVFLAIVLFHFAAALALIYAVKVRERPVPQRPMTGTIYFEPKTVTPPPPLPRPQFERARFRIPELPPLGLLPSDSAHSFQPVAQPTSSLPIAAPAPVRVSGGIGKGFPDTADYYPPSAIRLGEAGLTAVNVCVDDRGRLTTDPKIAVSSGNPRLDGGALALARAGSGHYRSTTENGRAISACFQVGVRFTLRN